MDPKQAQTYSKKNWETGGFEHGNHVWLVAQQQEGQTILIAYLETLIIIGLLTRINTKKYKITFQSLFFSVYYLFRRPHLGHLHLLRTAAPSPSFYNTAAAVTSWWQWWAKELTSLLLKSLDGGKICERAGFDGDDGGGVCERASFDGGFDDGDELAAGKMVVSMMTGGCLHHSVEGRTELTGGCSWFSSLDRVIIIRNWMLIKMSRSACTTSFMVLLTHNQKKMSQSELTESFSFLLFFLFTKSY